MPPRYAELRCKSSFSFLAGASHPEELVDRAAELGLSGLAIGDRDGLYGVVRAHAQAKRRGFPLVVGAEVTCEELAPGGGRLVLLAADREGYANLCRLVTLSRRGVPVDVPGAVDARRAQGEPDEARPAEEASFARRRAEAKPTQTIVAGGLGGPAVAAPPARWQRREAAGV